METSSSPLPTHTKLVTFLSFSSKKKMLLASLFTLLIAAKVSTAFTSGCRGNSTPKFPAILAFGDSTVDTGNNNFIVTPFKGDHGPYGQDFLGGVASGRFSNGKLVPDILASILGLKDSVPPFLNPALSDRELLSGVSFASAGSGYDDLTTMLSRVIPVSRQVDYLKKYTERVERIVGKREAARIVSEAVVIVSAGPNDFIFNYYDVPIRRIQFTIDGYQNFLQTKLQSFIKALYEGGCRRIVVSGLPPIGCLPMQMTAKSPLLRSCCNKENEDAQSYNEKLEKLLPRMESELAGSKILYADIYTPLMDMISHPRKYGFAETRRGCCGSGLLEAGPLCAKFEGVCANSSNFMFWDSIHPSESTYKIISHKLAQSLIPKLC